MRRIKDEIKRLQEQEREQKEQELEMARQRQKAIDDLDRGVSLSEKQQPFPLLISLLGSDPEGPFYVNN